MHINIVKTSRMPLGVFLEFTHTLERLGISPNPFYNMSIPVEELDRYVKKYGRR